MHSSRWLLATLPLAAFASAQTCYWPDGGVASQTVACPVAGGTEAAACCFKNHYCMTNGVCFSKTELSFYRGACTDKTFNKSGCPKYCDKDDILGAVPGAHCGIAKCDGGKYTCQRSSNCANYTFEVPAGQMLLNQYLQADITTATATGTTGESTGSTTGAGSTATCAPTAAASSGISTGAAAGIGAGIGAPLAIAIAVLTMMLLREKKKTRAALATQMPAGTAPSSPWTKSEQTAYVPVEAHGQSMPPELPQNHQNRHELS